MDEFKQRRINLAKQISSDSVIVLFGAKLQIRNGDAEYPFRQNSDFYYLTGFAEPNAVLVLTKDAKNTLQYILFNQPNNPEAEIWNGKRAGQEGACKEFGADLAYTIEAIDSVLPELLINKLSIYYALGECTNHDQKVIHWLKAAKRNLNEKSRGELQKTWHTPDTLIDVLPLIHAARVFKSAQEIDYMRRAAEISALAHLNLMRNCKPGIMEYQLESIFNASCLSSGSRGLAYNSIVAGGDNSCTLHYVTNDKPLVDGDLVLVDAGGEYNYYAADITRTFPVNGKFSAEQKLIYNLVLDAQLVGIAQVRPGNSWDSVQEAMLKVLVAGLVDLGLLHGEVKQLIKDSAYRKFYMHSSGHWLGMDVHDVGKYKIQGHWRKFEPGMVLTVEPGIYIARDSVDVDPKWHGIGVRIEDDVLVTKKGNEVLSHQAPKQIAEIESAFL